MKRSRLPNIGLEIENAIANMPASCDGVISEMLRQIRLSLIMAIAYRDISLLDLARCQARYLVLSDRVRACNGTRALVLSLHTIMSRLNDLSVDAVDIITEESLCREITKCAAKSH